MLDNDQRAKLMEQFRSLPERAAAAVRGLNEAQLDTPYREGGWTVRQVIHHLADADLNAFIRTKFILTEEKPTLKVWDQDTWAGLPDTTLMPVQPSLAILQGLHDRWYALLRSLPEAGWKRAGNHPDRGEITVEDLLALYTRHGESHLGQILHLRGEKGW